MVSFWLACTMGGVRTWYLAGEPVVGADLVARGVVSLELDGAFQQLRVQAAKVVLEEHDIVGHATHGPPQDQVQGPFLALQGRPIQPLPAAHTGSGTGPVSRPPGTPHPAPARCTHTHTHTRARARARVRSAARQIWSNQNRGFRNRPVATWTPNLLRLTPNSTAEKVIRDFDCSQGRLRNILESLNVRNRCRLDGFWVCHVYLTHDTQNFQVPLSIVWQDQTKAVATAELETPRFQTKELLGTEENLFSEGTIVVVHGAFLLFFFTDFQKCVTCVTVLVFRHFFAFCRFSMFYYML